MPTISKPFCSTIEVHIFTRRGTLSILELDVRGTLFGKTSCSRLADIGHSSRGTPKFDEEKCAYYKQFILILIYSFVKQQSYLSYQSYQLIHLLDTMACSYLRSLVAFSSIVLQFEPSTSFLALCPFLLLLVLGLKEVRNFIWQLLDFLSSIWNKTILLYAYSIRLFNACLLHQ